MAKTKVTPGWVGPLYQAKDGKRPWVCEYGDWETGNRHRENFGHDRDEARKGYGVFVGKMAKREHTPRSSRKFDEAIDAYDQWFEERCHRGLKGKLQASDGRLYNIRSKIKNHIRPRLGHMRLHDLETRKGREIMQRFIWDLHATGKTSLPREIDIILSEIFKRCVSLGWLGASPFAKERLDVPEVEKEELSIPTCEQACEIWKAANARLHKEDEHTFLKRRAAIACGLYGGMEHGVVCALWWEDVDWVKSEIDIRRSFSRELWKRDGVGLKDPKRDARKRVIPMSQEMRLGLSALWEFLGRPTAGFAFQGSSQYAEYVAIYMNYLCRTLFKCGYVHDNQMPWWSFHRFRHYAGSIWLEECRAANGAITVDGLEEVAQMLGHKDSRTTKEWYIHLFKEEGRGRQRKIMDAVTERHRLIGMREKCEIGFEDAEIIEP